MTTFVANVQKKNETATQKASPFLPNCGVGIAGHAPVAAWTETHAAHLRAIGQARTLELLGEETAQESLQPFAVGGFVVVLGCGVRGEG